MLVDLHTHSTFSDGRYTPTQLVEEAAAKGIVTLALADHDSWNGVEEAKQAAEEKEFFHSSTPPLEKMIQDPKGVLECHPVTLG